MAEPLTAAPFSAEAMLIELMGLTFRQTQQHGDKTAGACAKAVLDCLFLNFKGILFYVPVSDKSARDELYERIWQEFTGDNYKALAIKYRLSLMSIYSITKRCRRQYIRKVQNDLFPIVEEADKKPVALVVLDEYLPAELERAGLTADDAQDLAAQIRDYLLTHYPGIAVPISEKIYRKLSEQFDSPLF